MRSSTTGCETGVLRLSSGSRGRETSRDRTGSALSASSPGTSREGDAHRGTSGTCAPERQPRTGPSHNPAADPTRGVLHTPDCDEEAQDAPLLDVEHALDAAEHPGTRLCALCGAARFLQPGFSTPWLRESRSDHPHCDADPNGLKAGWRFS
ncbi:DUF6233 domain-containing protein [Streptomyces mirabilis]|uniref:DUF6233 domain-containing protein n=1 Tax=Streptomyces mirabilis TaxID=68239 RepID=UPI0036E1E47B